MTVHENKTVIAFGDRLDIFIGTIILFFPFLNVSDIMLTTHINDCSHYVGPIKNVDLRLCILVTSIVFVNNFSSRLAYKK